MAFRIKFVIEKLLKYSEAGLRYIEHLCRRVKIAFSLSQKIITVLLYTQLFDVPLDPPLIFI